MTHNFKFIGESENQDRDKNPKRKHFKCDNCRRCFSFMGDMSFYDINAYFEEHYAPCNLGLTNGT